MTGAAKDEWAEPADPGEGRNDGITDLRRRIREHWDGFSPAGRAVCRSLAESSAEHLLFMSAIDLGQESRTSNATVIRTLQALGYSGLPELKSKVAAPFTTSTRPELRARQRIEASGGDLPNVWARVHAESLDRIELMRTSFDLESYAHAVELLLSANRVITYGFGASTIAAVHLALKIRRIGRRARCIEAAGFPFADELLAIERGDVVVVFAPARLVTDVEVLLDRSRAVGAPTVLITDELGDQLRDDVTAVLHSPNTPTGLTGEPLTSLVLADALVQAMAASDVERSVESSHTLNALREQLGFTS
jgi:DNA-binding MurR/RpiR family transcriptional regulator